jgi:hypothetical protein
MSKKSLNANALMNELRGTSSFFQSREPDQFSTSATQENKQEKITKESENTVLPTSQQTSRQSNQQAGMHASPLASKPAGNQISKELKKFTSYLTVGSIKAMKRIAFDSERKDYEVLQEAVDTFLKSLGK